MRLLAKSAIFASLVVLSRRTTAFSLQRAITRPHQSSTTRLYNKDPKKSEDDSSFDVETARKQLESLFGDGDGDGERDDATSSASAKQQKLSIESLLKDGFSLPRPPPLSTIERDRRIAEIQALKELADNDDGVAALWKLWYSERGASAASLLEQADQLMQDASTWHYSEVILTELIQQYGVYFVEPINRLATLYFLQGRLDDSYKLCRVILQIKPWHVGALSGIIQVCIGQGDVEEARKYAFKRLPPLSANTGIPFYQGGPTNPQRIQWVERMVVNAKECLQAAEQRKQKQLGKPEEYYLQKSSPLESSETKPAAKDEGDAWQ